MPLIESFRSWFGRPTADVTVYWPSVHQVMGMGVADLYRTQPHLRTVVSFLARNIAQLPVHVFDRVSDEDRRRVTGEGVALVVKRPNEHQTWFELMYSTVSELKLYDVAVWSVAEAVTPSGWDVRLIPSSWITSTGGGDAWAPKWIQVARPGGEPLVLKQDDFLLFHGYRPGEPSKGASPIDSLREILAEQIQAWSYRQQIWQRGGRVGTVITRPKDAPWSNEARTKFSRDWAAKWTGNDGPKAGGTPILEDGMTLSRVGFSAREDEWSEVAKLSLATVASVYHTNPTMVGILDNANFSNVKEFARMLYTDTLGPDLAMFEQRINGFLLPRMGAPESQYVEFAIAAKMAGSFEEQATVLSSSVGAPWMSRNEARARLNLPRIDGGDALVTPLNVLIGGQASPQDSGSQNVRGAAVPVKSDPQALDLAGERGVYKRDPVRVKAVGREADSKALEALLKRFFGRQRRVVLSELGSKSPDWWDAERWNKELAADLFELALEVADEIGAETLAAAGLTDEFDVDATYEFLQAVAESRASMLNDKTLAQLEAALDGDLGEDAAKSTPEGVFDEAETTRAEQSAATLATTLAGFVAVEALRQSGSEGVTKTWVVTSANPRASHAAMDGETVGLDDKYSNGMDWPGDVAGAGGDGGEIANCSCVSEMTIP